MSKKIVVLGEGAWGTAIASVLAHNGYTVHLWCYNQDVAQTIKNTQINERYLPGITLPRLIIPTSDMQEVLHDAKVVFEAIPVQFLRSILVQAKPFFTSDQTWVVLSKGIEQETLLFPTQIIDDVFGTEVSQAVLAGPSFARDVALQKITAVSLASSSCKVAQAIQKILACK